MTGRKTLLNIIEGLVLAGLLIFIISMLSAGSSKDIPIPEVRDKMMAQADTSDMIPKDDAGTDSVLGLVPSDYMYYRTDEIMDVRELFIARTSDEDEMDRIESAIKSHLDKQIDNFTGYGAGQLDLLEHAVYMRKGDYCFFAVGEKAEEWQSAFLNLIR